MKRIFSFVFLLGVVTCWLHAQLVYENRTYSPLVKTVTLRKTSKSFDAPVISLQKGERLILEFDDLREETKRYEYKLIHCNADWTQSSLPSTEYTEGFDVQPIETFENSFNTIQRYVHYTQIIPSADMRITKSGNYIIKVFAEGNEDNVILTRRMYVCEDKTVVKTDVRPSQEASLFQTHQQVNVRVEGKDGMFFQNPDRYMTVKVMQNNNDVAAHVLKMNSSSGSGIDFSYGTANQFAAGNEFRSFDFTSLRRKTQYVAEFDFVNNQNTVYLREMKLRDRLPYSKESDINGNFYIRNEYGDNAGVTSDYAWVNFVLNTPMSLEGTYFVVGAMTDWRPAEMQFADGKYRLSLYLKQGYYNYMIAFGDRNAALQDIRFKENDFAITNNVYTVLVYYHNFADDYDELIGYASVEYNH
ncbi:MAG: DUF5103 domain-containing protein [Bacteroidales bacterium]|nr:DUF5103 domain-containing protein [Bacteroidales bacterium]